MFNKKLLGLVLAGMLAVPFVGCGNKEVEQELPPQLQQQELPNDEDLNQYYQDNNQQSQLQQAKQIIHQVMAENFEGVDYELIENDEHTGFVICINITDDDVAFDSIENWNYLVSVMVDFELAVRQGLQQVGLDVPTGVMVADIPGDVPYLCITNGQVLYDVFNHIDLMH